MRCGICNYAPLEVTTVTLEEWDGDELIVIGGVPVEKCPRCGEEYFSPEVLEKLEMLVEQRHRMPKLQPDAMLQVPFFSFGVTPNVRA